MLTTRYENIFSARKRRIWCQWDIEWAWINQWKEFIWFENGFGKFFRNRKNVQKCPAKSLENDSTKIRARQFSLQLLTSTPVTLSSINLHVNIGIRRPSKCILCYHPNSILSFVISKSMSKWKAWFTCRGKMTEKMYVFRQFLSTVLIWVYVDSGLLFSSI